jgi:hypothetical protein
MRIEGTPPARVRRSVENSWHGLSHRHRLFGYLSSALSTYSVNYTHCGLSCIFLFSENQKWRGHIREEISRFAFQIRLNHPSAPNCKTSTPPPLWSTFISPAGLKFNVYPKCIVQFKDTSTYKRSTRCFLSRLLVLMREPQ